MPAYIVYLLKVSASNQQETTVPYTENKFLFNNCLIQGSKSVVRIAWISQSRTEFVYNITRSRFVIGQFKQCEPTISNPSFISTLNWSNTCK